MYKNLIIAFLLALVIFDVGAALIINKTNTDLFRSGIALLKKRDQNVMILGAGTLVVTFLIYHWLDKNHPDDT